MSQIQTFQVYPKVPQNFAFAEKMVRNLWWTWYLDAIELLRRIDPKLWNQSGRNPILFFTQVPQKKMEAMAEDEGFLAHLKRVQDAYQKFVEAPARAIDDPKYQSGTVAYFSMEYGVHESLPLFAGGLGILAGDHLKAASDRGEPIVGVGLLYRLGYFHQYLDQNGWQQEEYPETDLYQLPISRARDTQGKELHITVPGPDGDIHAQVLRIMIGRVPLFLLDTNVTENSVENRNITSRLYIAEAKNRLAQEVLLGIGGMKALDAMGIHPQVCHLNEGHCSFVVIERLAQMVQHHQIDLKTAMEVVPRTMVFTTHTPVAAGHDEFPVDMVKPYLREYEQRLDTSIDNIISWGQTGNPGDHPPFSMFALGLRMAHYCNGVSELHGRVARRMWTGVWPGRPENEIPIRHITNGVHIPSWISVDNWTLFDRYIGPDWFQTAWKNPQVIDRIDDIYDEELWRSHELSRARMIRVCRSLMMRQYGRRNAPKSQMEDAASVLDHDALTIGFARRFATYKRAYLLLRDPARLESLLTSREFPVQFVFAGKAHPRDNEGKELIRRIVDFARKANVRNRFIFLEDYDPYIARHLVQGCDIWLNTPRRPYEACGTSGIKAAANGVLNVSILDGWWCEGYSSDTGFKIGNGEEYDDWDYQDDVECQAVFNVLENEVIPKFYDRRNGDAPAEWIRMMKASMKMAMHRFCAHEMVEKYATLSYLPASRQFHRLLEKDAAEAHRLRDLRAHLLKHWPGIRISRPERNTDGPFRVGDQFTVTASVFLGEILPEEVDVEVCYGRMKTLDRLDPLHNQKMEVKEDRGGGAYLYFAQLTCQISGRYGLTARISPSGDDFLKSAPGMLTWA